jgi:hypothetical protein
MIADPAAQAAIVNSTRVNFYQFGSMFGEGGFLADVAEAGVHSLPARQRGSALR